MPDVETPGKYDNQMRLTREGTEDLSKIQLHVSLVWKVRVEKYGDRQEEEGRYQTWGRESGRIGGEEALARDEGQPALKESSCYG